MTTMKNVMKKDYASAVFAFMAACLSQGNVFFAIMAIFFSVASMFQSTDRYNIHMYVGINIFNIYSLLKGLFGIILVLLAA